MTGKSKKTMSKWVVGLIAVIIVVGVIYLILLPSGLNENTLGTTCFPRSGFLCIGVGYYHSNGTASFTLGQNVSTNWQIVKVMFLSNRSSYQNVTTLAWNSTNATQIRGGLQEGTSKLVNIPVSGPVSVGTNRIGWL